MNKIFTIGFTGKNAETFFTLLKQSEARRLVDVRLNNISQLAAFSKKDDLKYFLKEILKWDYSHKPDFAPNEEILSNYKKKIITWEIYTKKYSALLENRNILETTTKDEILNSVLLCSEHDPKYCHRRLLAEYLKNNWGNIEIIHLK